jgi:hypothetical protein
MGQSFKAKAAQVHIRLILAVGLAITSSINLSYLSSAADSLGRVARSLDAIPRPSELGLGLSQIQYRGYFERDSSWFSNSRYTSSVLKNSTTPSSGPVPIESSSTPTPTSYSWTGYFIADITGEWGFRVTADDAAFVWIGNDAVAGYSSKLNTPFLDASWPDKLTDTKRISLVKNKIYPLRIQYGNSGGPASFKFNFLAPGTPNWSSDFETLLWRSPELTGDCTNFGLSYTLAIELGYANGVPEVCRTDGTDKFRRTWIMIKPDVPKLNFTKLTSSGLVVNVSLGDTKVTSIYLTAPKIGYSTTSKLLGKIVGDTAVFTIPINKLKNLSQIEINLFSTNNQGTVTAKKSVPVAVSSKAPSASPKATPSATKKTVPAPKTIRCEKGDKSRVFAGTTCPPGWSK